jgi:hemerythrin-like metal-binding protein
MLVWSKNYAIGIPRLDADHVTLVSLLNQLHINLAEEKSGDAVEPILAALQHYGDSHFVFEESLMEELSYPELETHRDGHDGFCIRVARLSQEHRSRRDVARDLRALLNSWLFDHVLRVDGQFGRWLRTNRVTLSGPSDPSGGGRLLQNTAVHIRLAWA